MSLFAVTFRIEYDTETRYDKVYESLVAAIKAESRGSYWDDPTSFFLITSDRSSADLADTIVANTKGFDSSKDLVFVINLSVTKGHSAKGHIIDKDITALMASR
jgi:hypothetical protein